MMNCPGCPGWMGGWMMLFPILFLIAIVVGAMLVIRAVQGGSRWRPREPGGEGRRDPLEILEERFARGEIDAQEFEERRRTLRP